ncbi:hypothetical protein AgCh_024001 [Apium graveolens]
MNQKEHLGSSPVYGRPHESSTHPQTLEESQQAQPHKPSKRKKQIRRRLLTSGPYEENALDMAVARREIVSALRIHRACINQNSENHPQAPHQTHSASSSRVTQPQHKRKSKSRKNSKLYDFRTTLDCSNNLNNLSYQSFPYQPHQTSYPWPMCFSAPQPENFNLPNRTLGLNLNLQAFDGLDTTVLQNNYIPEICYASTSPSTSYSLPLQPSSQTLGLNLNVQAFDDLHTTVLQDNYIPEICYTSTSPSTSNPLPLPVSREETLSVGLLQMADPGVEGDLGLHHAVDNEEMAVIISMGEKHQIEWDDTINMVTSVCWSYFLKNKENDTNRFGTEFPHWLDTNDNCSQQLDEPSDYFQDPTLPQTDIGQIEGTDGEWLG